MLKVIIKKHQDVHLQLEIRQVDTSRLMELIIEVHPIMWVTSRTKKRLENWNESVSIKIRYLLTQPRRL